MKKIIKALIFFVILVASGILIFEYSYKLTLDDFITDKTTLIYTNKNIDREKLKKFEDAFDIKNVTEKEILEKIKSICLVSQSKIYSSNIKIVGIVDVGSYYPLMYINIKKYFDIRDDYFYRLKDEYKKELGFSYIENIYLKPYRGLFFVGTDTSAMDKIIHNSNDKNSIKTVEILNEHTNDGLGTLVFNQERERLFGIDRIVISGDTKGNDIIFDGSIYGDNDIIKDLGIQPKERIMNKYITDNRLYISTSNLKKMDTFILRAISYKTRSAKKINFIQELFVRGFSDIMSELNGELVVDLKNENYLFGLKSSENAEYFAEYFRNDENINIEKDVLGNIYICIGGDTFIPSYNAKQIESNQFLSGMIDTHYGKVEAEGYYYPERLRIKAKIEIKK